MGQRGPKPLPSNVHLLRGNPSKKPIFELGQDFRPEVEIPDCPPWMWSEAKKEFRRITPELLKYGLISKVDRAAIALYCQAWAEYVHFKKQLTRQMKQAEQRRAEVEGRGETYDGDDGFMMKTPNGGFAYSPYWVAANKASDQVDKFLQSFGLSPSSRARVSVSDNRQQSLFEGEGPGEWDKM